MLLQLRSLRNFSIKSNSRLFLDPITLSKTIRMLPPSLEKLSIASQDVLYTLINFDAEATANSLTHISSEYPRGTSRCYDIESVFPRLVELTISEDLADLIHPTPLPYNEIAIALPSKLTRLAASNIFIDRHSPTFMSLLPRTLTSIDATVEIGAPRDDADVLADWNDAPPSLAYISCIRWHTGPENHSWVPRSLTGGRIDNILNPGDKPSVAEQKLRTLPSGLLTVAVQQPSNARNSFDHFDLLALLPQSLTELALTLPIHNFCVASLPVTLQKLTLIERFNWNWQKIRAQKDEWEASRDRPSFWPPELYMLLIRSIPLDPEDVDLIPSYLRELDFSISDRRQRYSLALPHLQTLKTLFGYSMKPITIKGNLQKLTTLEMNAQSEFALESIEALPASLTTFIAIFPVPLVPHSEFWKLPSALTTLHLFTMFSSAFKDLPRTLTDLHVLKVSTGPQMFTNTLPTSLRSLRITSKAGAARFVMPPDSFSSLIKLESLVVPFTDCSSAIFRHLPPNLKILQVMMDELNYHDAPFIPARLTNLHLGIITNTMGEYIIPYWPIRSLETLPARLHSAALKQRYNL